MNKTPFQTMPDLDPEELKALRDSIARDGIQQPIVVDEAGNIIDGHHRKRIADELGIECPQNVRDRMSEADKLRLSADLNLHRRHLTGEKKKELIEKLLKTDPSLSDRQIAKATGTSPTTVGTTRAKAEERGDVSKLDTRTDTMGRKQAATKPVPKRDPAVMADIRKTFTPKTPDTTDPQQDREAERMRAATPTTKDGGTSNSPAHGNTLSPFDQARDQQEISQTKQSADNGERISSDREQAIQQISSMLQQLASTHDASAVLDAIKAAGFESFLNPSKSTEEIQEGSENDSELQTDQLKRSHQ